MLPPRPSWGLAVQLYATRSETSWGIGDLGDLKRLGRWAARELGAGFLLLNPLHAVRPGLPQQASPYYPSSRRFRNPLYLRVDGAPSDLVERGRALNQDRRIDRNAVCAVKMEALSGLWARFEGHPAFEKYCAEQGEALDNFATFNARSGHAGANADADFHRWLQWLIDVQLAEAAEEITLVSDLAVGFDPDGADAWEFQDVLASGVSIGAPPDAFNAAGQDWGLPPFDPDALRAANFRPFVETLRAAFRHAGGIRIDHVMGLFRLYWVPHGGAPADGSYVRYPSEELLDIVAAESRRAGAFVVGEDLGTVEEGVREELAARQVLSYRVLWFEPGAPSSYPEQALAAVSTHDLPTIPGVWTGADPAAPALRERLVEAAGVDVRATVDEAVEQTYAALAQAPSLLVAASLEDALGVTERPNQPGTVNETNWSLALPLSLEEIESDPRMRRIAGALSARTLG
ncbi:MAG TPA: 4-alpha-glucanotransferase [Acidimicrobiales bacterium]|nr:4-alpha-glucanotransferase [Acidimicrobiales bacterium]